MIIKQVVSSIPNEKEWVGSVPDEEGVLLWRLNRSANANAGIAKPNLPTIIANAVVRL